MTITKTFTNAQWANKAKNIITGFIEEKDENHPLSAEAKDDLQYVVRILQKIKDQDKKQTQAAQQAEIEYHKLLAINDELKNKINELNTYFTSIESSIQASATILTAEFNLLLIQQMKQLRIDLEVDAERRSETQAIKRAMVTLDEARKINNQDDTPDSPPPTSAEKTQMGQALEQNTGSQREE